MKKMYASIDEVRKDKTYIFREDKALNSWPQAYQLTVEDSRDDSLWCVVYAVYDDDAETHTVVEWSPAKEKLIKTYEAVR